MARNLMHSNRPWAVIGVAVGLVVVVLVLGYQSFKATEKATFDEFNERQLVIAEGVARGIELYFEFLASALGAVANIPDVQLLDESAARRDLRRCLEELAPMGVNDVGVMDVEGVVRYTVTAPQLEGQDFSWRRYYQETRQSASSSSALLNAPPAAACPSGTQEGGPIKRAWLASSRTYIIEFVEFKGTDAGQKGVLVAVPMFEPKSETNIDTSPRFAGIVLCTLKLDTITERFVAPVHPSGRGHAFLIDDEFNVLWSPDPSTFGKNPFRDSEVPAACRGLIEIVASGETGAAEYSHYRFDDSDGAYTREWEEKLTAYAPIHLGKNRWTIGVWAPKADARKLIRAAYLRQLLLVGLIVLIILLGSLYALTSSSRIRGLLEKEVAAKTGALTHSHERLLTVLDSLDALVYVADIETREILFVNQRFRDQFGDVVGKPCWAVLQEGLSKPCSFCTNDELLGADGTPTGVRAREYENMPTGRWYDIRDRAIRWADGRFVRLDIAIDITDRKQAEQELAQYRDHLEDLVEVRTKELQESREQLQLSERLASIGTLAAGIAHEINNPIGGILLCARNALDTVKDAESQKLTEHFLDQIAHEAKRCGQIVKNVLQFARQEKAEKMPGDLNTVLRRAVELTREYANENGVELEYHGADALPPLIMSSLEMEQAFVNLIRNAIEAVASFECSARESAAGAGDGGLNADAVAVRNHVVVSSEKTVHGIRVTVQDTGYGVTEEQKRRLFDPFYTTRQQRGGTGLGLSISHGIVKEHRGTIDVQSQLDYEPSHGHESSHGREPSHGRGTTVIVEFPTEVMPASQESDVQGPDR